MVLYLIARPDQVKQKTLRVLRAWFNYFFHIFHAFMLKKLSTFVERIKFVDFYGWMHF
jgi:hypothetical protein